jgi:hypothetical protein
MLMDCVLRRCVALVRSGGWAGPEGGKMISNFTKLHQMVKFESADGGAETRLRNAARTE